MCRYGVASLIYALALLNVSAENNFLEPENNTINTPKIKYIYTAWTDKDVYDVEIKRNMILAQLNTPAERQKKAEIAEKTALKKLKELKKKIKQRKEAKQVKKQAEIKRVQAKKQAEIKRRQEIKRKKQARIEKQRELRLKEAERLKAEAIARKKQEALQQKTRQAKFLKKIASHSCGKYDINNKIKVLACLDTLEDSRNKKKSSELPNIWTRKSTCNEIKKNVGDNLRAMGFWEDVIKDRTPSCKMLSDVYKIKFSKDVYWSKCVEQPSRDDDYISSCISSEKKRQKELEDEKRRVEWVKALELLAEKKEQRYYKKAEKRNAILSKNNSNLNSHSKTKNDESVLNNYIDLVVAQLQYQIFKEISDTVDNRLLILGLTYGISNVCSRKFKKSKWNIIAPHLIRKDNSNSYSYKNNQWYEAGFRYILKLKKHEGCNSKKLRDIWYKSIIWIGEESDWKNTKLSKLRLVKNKRFEPRELGRFFPGSTMDIDMLSLLKSGAKSTVKAIIEDVSFESDRGITVCRYTDAEDKHLNSMQTYLFWLHSAPSKKSRNIWNALSSYHPLLKIPALPIKGACPATAKETQQLGARPIIKSYASRIPGYYLMSCSYSKSNVMFWYKSAPPVAQLKAKKLATYKESSGSTPIIGLTECPTSWNALIRIHAEFTD